MMRPQDQTKSGRRETDVCGTTTPEANDHVAPTVDCHDEVALVAPTTPAGNEDSAARSFTVIDVNIKERFEVEWPGHGTQQATITFIACRDRDEWRDSVWYEFDLAVEGNESWSGSVGTIVGVRTKEEVRSFAVKQVKEMFKQDTVPGPGQRVLGYGIALFWSPS
jgi:hypothetical protein